MNKKRVEVKRSLPESTSDLTVKKLIERATSPRMKDAGQEVRAELRSAFNDPRFKRDPLRVLFERRENIKPALDLLEEVGKSAFELDNDVSVGRSRREQQREFGRRGVETAKKAADRDRAAWLEAARKIRKKHPDKNKYSAHRIAREVHDQLKPDRTVQTIHKYLLKIQL